MSSGSSEVDVIRTRIPAYGDDNIVLYAYEPNTAYNNNEHVQSEVSCNEEEQKTMMDILTQCQVINDAIQNLDKKCDVIYGKVSKIYRCRAKSLWQNRKPHGYAHKNHNYQLSRKQKFQRMRKREPHHSSFSYSESYSPTVPVGRRDNDSQSHPPGTPFNSDESVEPEHDSLLEEQERDAILRHSPSLSSSSYQPSCDNDQVKYDLSCFLSIEVTSSPVERDSGILKQSFSEDPSTWSVEEVILFLKQEDPQTLGPLADLFRHHDIDGKALLLLKSDMMLTYMGLKLGTAVKLCHCIEKLKDDKYDKEKKYCDN
ncbi:PREDICTED: sex comb on midleg-like protein 1 [Propithecus coquereli]|uniref:sex comb on midleg-like protein 1 n=1 Tax=Propithecus coquereli TaxID=379532 RepID=UPI00063EFCCE|nr:PREDICTED: sex comb on midleg-like protein 1 [Propithecus coquereli]